MLRVVATVRSEAEAEMVCARLADQAIHALYKRNAGADLPQFGAGGARDVYVQEEDAERARELLATEDLSDEELSELSERAFREATGHEPPSV